VAGTLPQIAPTLKLSSTPGELRSPPPRLGQHTHEILASLGYTDEFIEQMARDKVIDI
jgi:crotonobetainyl-CoA:carnitine CoA-transferase CaiB-like acyl-CoA transferase